MKSPILTKLLCPGMLLFLAANLQALRAPAAEPYQFATFAVPFQAPPAEKNGGTMLFGMNDRDLLVGSYGVSNRFRADGKTHIVDGFIFARGVFHDVSIADAVLIDLMGANSRGTIVGDYKDAAGDTFCFVRERDGEVRALPPAMPGALFAQQAIGINNRGTIVGSYSLDPTFALSSFQGFILEGDDYTTFNYPGQQGTVLQRVNDNGTILGRWFDANGNGHGFLLGKHRHLTAVEVPGAMTTNPFGLNNHGEVVGTFRYPDKVRHSFVLSGGVYTVLDVPGTGVKTFAYGINDRGEIVGYYQNGNITEGFVAAPSR